MNAKETLEEFQKELGTKLINSEIRVREHAVKKAKSVSLWMEIDKSAMKDVVKRLCEMYENPHFTVISGYQEGEDIWLIYHFTINYAHKHDELALNFKFKLTKPNLKVETICDLIPGALISEREIQEMLGVTVKNIPDSRRFFLDYNFPKGVYPWRRDKTGPDKLVRNLHDEGGKK
ncbi:MAG: NADH-quinone oxidoreductase subunit C [archaeon]